MSRRGFTLVEILLVLAILVVLAAAAVPALNGVLLDQRLKSGADQVRVAWTRAHVTAMKSGRIQVFRYEMGADRYVVQPWTATDEVVTPGSENRPDFRPLAEQDRGGPRIDESAALALPAGVRFIAGDARIENRSIQIERQIQDANSFSAEWSRPILFYPDGSSSEAFVVVANERDAAIQVQLRAMTGTASIGEIFDLAELAR
jgi:prepilin-type N-terminal cleavage/methylation domain-containing protein